MDSGSLGWSRKKQPDELALMDITRARQDAITGANFNDHFEIFFILSPPCNNFIISIVVFVKSRQND